MNNKQISEESVKAIAEIIRDGILAGAGYIEERALNSVTGDFYGIDTLEIARKIGAWIYE